MKKLNKQRGIADKMKDAKNIDESMIFTIFKGGDGIEVVANKEDISDYSDKFLFTIHEMLTEELRKRTGGCDNPECDECYPPEAEFTSDLTFNVK